MQISLDPGRNVCERDMQEAALTGGRIESKAGNDALRRPESESLSLDAYRLTAANNERQGSGSVWDKWTESDVMGAVFSPASHRRCIRNQKLPTSIQPLLNYGSPGWYERTRNLIPDLTWNSSSSRARIWREGR
jgi:hypothetical protein